MMSALHPAADKRKHVAALLVQLGIISTRMATHPTASPHIASIWKDLNLSVLRASFHSGPVKLPNEICGASGCHLTKAAPLVCARCASRYYCSVDCQRA